MSQPMRREPPRQILAGALLLSVTLSLATATATLAGALPNFVIVFTDDQGYADLGTFGAKGFRTPNLELYDLEKDTSETTNIAAQHPEVVARLQKYVERARADLGDRLTRRRGSGVREPGRLPSDGK